LKILGLAHQISANEKISIGLTRQDDDSWHWTDGATAKFTNWADGEPEDTNGNRCAFLDASELGQGQWFSTACDDDYSFICEVTPDHSNTNTCSRKCITNISKGDNKKRMAVVCCLTIALLNFGSEC
jgi:hypothetical protein